MREFILLPKAVENGIVDTLGLQGHGTLDAIYASVAASCKVRKWDGVDLLIIGGDFEV